MTNNQERLKSFKNTSSKILKDWGVIIVGIVIIAFWGTAIIRNISLMFIDLYTTSFSTNLDSTKTGPIGDTFGGTAGPYIALIASFLTFIAFWVQFRANQEVRHQFKIQQFESQFYEMLRLHKENISEMKIVGYERVIQKSVEKDQNNNVTSKIINTTVNPRTTEGRKVFVTMITELISCYEILEYYNNLWNEGIKKKHLLNLAYKFFFFGCKSDIVSSKHIDKATIKKFGKRLDKISQEHKRSAGTKNKIKGTNGKSIKLYIKYVPFSGHENRLGHYYRHLYSTVKYVVNNEKKGLFDYWKAREYLKILRSQMSNDEQLMLYYNYIIGFGKDWENEGFLTKYRMLHNLPINKVQYAKNPRKHFKKFIKTKKSTRGDLFEWGDVEK